MDERLRLLVVAAGILFGVLLSDCAVAEECDRAVGLEYGDLSPCTGVLWPTDWTAGALECQVILRNCEATLSDTAANAAGCMSDFHTLSGVCERAFQDLSDVSLRAAGIERPWWESRWLWGAVGVIVGSTTTYGLVRLTSD